VRAKQESRRNCGEDLHNLGEHFSATRAAKELAERELVKVGRAGAPRRVGRWTSDQEASPVWSGGAASLPAAAATGGLFIAWRANHGPAPQVKRQVEEARQDWVRKNKERRNEVRGRGGVAEGWAAGPHPS
jgi:hypothetical protein